MSDARPPVETESPPADGGPDAEWDLYDALFAYLIGETTEVPFPELGRARTVGSRPRPTA